MNIPDNPDQYYEMKKNYVEELRKALLTEDNEILKEHMRKWGIAIPIDEKVFELMRHKTITARTDLPIELRKRSKAWLNERDYRSLDDGDLE